MRKPSTASTTPSAGLVEALDEFEEALDEFEEALDEFEEALDEFEEALDGTHDLAKPKCAA